MPELPLTYDRNAIGPTVLEYSTTVAWNSHGGILSDGQSADDYAPVAAAELCRAINEEQGLEGEDAYTPRESYEPTQEELDVLRYQRRAAAFERLRNEFGAYNLGRVRSGEISPQDMAAWLRSTECEDVLAYLRLLMFEAAIATIPTMTGVGATEDFKQTWVAKLQAEL